MPDRGGGLHMWAFELVLTGAIILTTWLLSFFFSPTVPVGEHRNDSISILPRSVHCALMESIFYFLQTAFSYGAAEKFVPLLAES